MESSQLSTLVLTTKFTNPIISCVRNEQPPSLSLAKRTYWQGPYGAETYSPTSENPLLKSVAFVVGWGDRALRHPLVGKLAENVQATGLKLPRKAGNRRNHSSAIEYKAEALSQFLHDNTTHVLIGHSEGGVTATLALYDALRQKQQGKSDRPLPEHLILIAPAGTTGIEPPAKLTLRFIERSIRRFFASKESRKSYIERSITSKAFFVNPRVILQEAKGLSSISIWEKLQYLQENGIHVSIIAGAYDHLFPASILQERAKEAGIPCSTLPIPHDGVHTCTDILASEIYRLIDTFHKN